MKKIFFFITSILVPFFVMVGCASTKAGVIVNESLYDDYYNSVLQNKEKELLKKSPSFAQEYRQEAIHENMVKLPNNMPLYRQPFFAQMVVFPYISKSGIYYGYTEAWVKIKDGAFVLSNPKTEARERMFDINDVGKK